MVDFFTNKAKFEVNQIFKVNLHPTMKFVHSMVKLGTPLILATSNMDFHWASSSKIMLAHPIMLIEVRRFNFPLQIMLIKYPNKVDIPPEMYHNLIALINKIESSSHSNSHIINASSSNLMHP